MDARARQRSATAAIWRADALGRPLGDAARLGDVAAHTLGVNERQWNGAQVLGPDTPWDEVSRWFADHGMPWGALVPSELDVVPPGRHVVDQPVMIRDLTQLPPLPEVDLRWDAGEDAAAVQADGFAMPLPLSRDFVLPKQAGGQLVTAYVGDSPMATATLCVAEGVVGVYGVATVAGARRQGLGRAVTLAVLHEGLSRGCDLAFLNPSELGYGVYARLGFTDDLPMRIYAGT